MNTKNVKNVADCEGKNKTFFITFSRLLSQLDSGQTKEKRAKKSDLKLESFICMPKGLHFARFAAVCRTKGDMTEILSLRSRVHCKKQKKNVKQASLLSLSFFCANPFSLSLLSKAFFCNSNPQLPFILPAYRGLSRV